MGLNGEHGSGDRLGRMRRKGLTKSLAVVGLLSESLTTSTVGDCGAATATATAGIGAPTRGVVGTGLGDRSVDILLVVVVAAAAVDSGCFWAL